MPVELNLALVQFGAIERDVPATLAKAERLVAEAAEAGADVAVLPEFFSTEYFAQYRDVSYTAYAEREEDGPTFVALRDWAQRYSMSLIAGVYEKAAPGLLFDTVVFVDRSGTIVGRYRKTHPAAVRSLEKLYYRGGTTFPVVELEDWKIGCVICYDILFPEAARSAALNGAELIVMPFATWDEPLWPHSVAMRAFENGVYVAGVNKVGPEGDCVFDGRSCASDAEGRILTECSRTEEEVRLVRFDRDRLDTVRTEWPLLRDRRPEVYGRVVQETHLP